MKRDFHQTYHVDLWHPVDTGHVYTHAHRNRCTLGKTSRVKLLMDSNEAVELMDTTRRWCGCQRHTSKVWPETNIISFQQFVHSLFDKRHVPRFVDAAREENNGDGECFCRRRGCLRSGGMPRTLTSGHRTSAPRPAAQRARPRALFRGCTTSLRSCARTDGCCSIGGSHGAHTLLREIRGDFFHIMSPPQPALPGGGGALTWMSDVFISACGVSLRLLCVPILLLLLLSVCLTDCLPAWLTVCRTASSSHHTGFSQIIHYNHRKPQVRFPEEPRA